MNAWVPVIVTVSIAVIGWLVTRIYTQNQVITTQRETIDTQRRQIDRMEITDELTKKIMEQLPKPRGGGGR